MLNQDQAHRHYRLVEVLADVELKRGRSRWPLVEGWLELAERQSPGSPKAILEGDYVVTLPDGSLFKEVTYKAEQTSVGDSLPEWAAAVGRRWAYCEKGVVIISDGKSFSESELQVTPV